jgi:hypothetical protein
MMMVRPLFAGLNCGVSFLPRYVIASYFLAAITLAMLAASPPTVNGGEPSVQMPRQCRAL